jgi:Zn-dependent alcohol dehydrogenase
VNPHFLAVCLAVLAACAVTGILPAAVLAAKARQPALAAVAVVVALGVAAVLANAGADLW